MSSSHEGESHFKAEAAPKISGLTTAPEKSTAAADHIISPHRCAGRSFADENTCDSSAHPTDNTAAAESRAENENGSATDKSASIPSQMHSNKKNSKARAVADAAGIRRLFAEADSRQTVCFSLFLLNIPQKAEQSRQSTAQTA